MITIKFSCPCEDDLFRCIEFYKRDKEQRPEASAFEHDKTPLNQKSIYRLKRDLDVRAYDRFRDSDCMTVIGEVEKFLNLKVCVKETD